MLCMKIWRPKYLKYSHSERSEETKIYIKLWNLDSSPFIKAKNDIQVVNNKSWKDKIFNKSYKI